MDINIFKIVQDYTNFYESEKDDLIQLKDFITNEKDIYNSKNPIGHLTASGYIYAKEDKKILLLAHKKLNRLLQPGGHAEPTDTSLLNTAIREIYEETQLDNLELLNIFPDKNIPFDINTHFIPENPKKDMPAHYHHDFRYLFIVEKSTNINIDFNESNNYQWIPIKDLETDFHFKRIIDKIYKILNTDFKVPRYYSKILEKFNIDLTAYSSIVVSHIIPDCLHYLDSLNFACPISMLIPKPNSINLEILDKIKNKYPIRQITRNDIANSDEINNFINSSEKPIIIFDIGGYFAEYIKKNPKSSKKIKFIIEDTENGYQKYEKVNTNIPILSVARSILKENEDYLVGESVVFSAEVLMREVGKIIKYRKCGIIGFGKIGFSIGMTLLNKCVKPMVYDINPIKQLEAFNRMCDIETKDNLLKNADVLFLATGNHSLEIRDFRNLRNGTFVFSVTSSDDEIDSKYLESEYTVKQVHPHIYKYENGCNYFYLIRKGNAVNFIHNAVMDNFIHLVRSEMIVGANLLNTDSHLDKSNPIFEVDIETKKEISKIWINIFENSNY